MAAVDSTLSITQWQSLVELGCVRTNRVESSPIQSSQTQKDAAFCGLLTMAVEAVRTHQQSRVESSPTSLAESRVLMPDVSFSSVRLQ